MIDNTGTNAKLIEMQFDNYCKTCKHYPCVFSKGCNYNNELNCLNRFGFDNNTYNIKNHCSNIVFLFKKYNSVQDLSYTNIQNLVSGCIVWEAYQYEKNSDKNRVLNATNYFTDTKTILLKDTTKTKTVTKHNVKTSTNFVFNNFTKTATLKNINYTNVFTTNKTSNLTQTLCKNYNKHKYTTLPLILNKYNKTKKINTTKTIFSNLKITNNFYNLSSIENNIKQTKKIYKTNAQKDFYTLSSTVYNILENNSYKKNNKQKLITNIYEKLQNPILLRCLNNKYQNKLVNTTIEPTTKLELSITEKSTIIIFTTALTAFFAFFAYIFYLIKQSFVT